MFEAMNNLLTYIYGKIVSLSGKQVYQEKVPENTTPVRPYIVFTLNIPDRLQEQDRGFLEIDFWDNTNNIAALETLVSKVDGNSSRAGPTGLDELRYFDGNLQAVFYRILRTSIPDPDIKIRRRQLRYLVKVRFI